MSNEASEWTSAEKIGLLYNVPKKTIYKLTAEGRIPCVRVGRHLRYRPADVEAALAEGRETSATA